MPVRKLNFSALRHVVKLSCVAEVTFEQDPPIGADLFDRAQYFLMM
ncbi:MAG: hypothetical protein ACI80I_002287 [Akkermansiaceae bacterium]